MENNLSIVKDQFKELPNNIEAEQAVIGSILVNNEIFDEIKSLGKFKVKVSLHSEVDAEITISVTSADTIQ